MWVWVNTYRYIFSGMNIHLPAILGFTRYQGFDPLPCNQMVFANLAVVITSIPDPTPLKTNRHAKNPLSCDALVSEVKSNVPFGKQNWFTPGDGSKPWYLVNPKIAGKWMFIPLKMYL